MGRDRRKDLKDAVDDVDKRVEATDAKDAAATAAGGGADGDDDGGRAFVPFTEEDREEANAAFEMLLDAGYVTVGSYDLKADGNGRKVVTLSAFLPNSLDGRELDLDAAREEHDELPDLPTDDG